MLIVSVIQHINMYICCLFNKVREWLGKVRSRPVITKIN